MRVAASKKFTQITWNKSMNAETISKNISGWVLINFSFLNIWQFFISSGRYCPNNPLIRGAIGMSG